MKSIEKTFSDNEGNHLLVALYFCDDNYKRDSLHIPSEYSDVGVVDIDITKAYVDKPIHPAVFFKMSSWLLQQFTELEDTIFTFICSTDELATNHKGLLPQSYRWALFDKLYHRQAGTARINIKDVIVGPDGFQSLGRAFYRDKHAPIIHIVSAYLQEKQQLYQ
ncbi:MAG: hypothetical protein K2M11_11245 [Paramuribaculum sp.]|nr:hypothetical protein [Paramuribaculum sp.]